MGNNHHDHDHNHHGHHHHHHHHAPKNYNTAFIIGITLNFAFVIVEALFGVWSHSLALVADAGHNLSDVAGLIIAWGAFWLARKKPTAFFTFGLRKSSILAALLNSAFLLIAVGIILWEAVHRLLQPAMIESKSVMIVAGIGIVINSATALLFFKDKNDDINLKGAYLHMAADAFISLGVVASAFIISLTGFLWIDPLVSIVISLVIIWGTWDLLKQSVKLSMDAVPEGIDPQAVKSYLEKISDVHDVHDLHIWAMSTTETALTAHLTMKNLTLDNKKLIEVTHDLKTKFKIHHPTLQVELYEANFECHLKSEDVL